MQSAIYTGELSHARLQPKKHQFSYQIFLLWLNLDELEQVTTKVSGFSTSRWAALRFKRSDYLGSELQPLKQAVLAKMTELAKTPLDGKVFLLGQARTFGLYFSPVNFYYLQQPTGLYSHVLAEVSNTPWNDRHYYLVDLANQQPSEKAFHVSPFNPMDMQYKWKIAQPNEQLKLSLSCFQQTKHFTASLRLQRSEMNSKNLYRVLLSIPSMTLKTLWGIYWQALKLFLKGMPIYPHPDQGNQ
ncbi:DUF1365 domain-containing protein [Paraglaciecola aestuariivivens]